MLILIFFGTITTGSSILAIFAFGVATFPFSGVGVLNILPDGCARLVSIPFQVLLVLVIRLLELSRRTLVREQEKLFDHVDTSQYMRCHLIVIRLQVIK